MNFQSTPLTGLDCPEYASIAQRFDAFGRHLPEIFSLEFVSFQHWQDFIDCIEVLAVSLLAILGVNL
jgi:hypothetical protein